LQPNGPWEKTSLTGKEGEFMNANSRRNAFTLIEVLIVVIIMALLAATIIPQFSSSTTDEKKSSLNFNLHTMRSLIEMYKVHHNGTPPSFTNFADQMTKPTDVAGATSGTNLIYGPYLTGKIPANSFNGKSTLVEFTTTTDPTAPSGDGGWLYNKTTGSFFPNNAEFYP
jgi:general secretion pathway protein G